MFNERISATINTLLPILQRFTFGEYGIAVGGAHAKQLDDAESDLDLYLFSAAVLENDERTRLTLLVDPTIHDAFSYGWLQPFEQAGTDFMMGDLKIECWLRNTRSIQSSIDECIAGIVKREAVTWTTTGFYNHCCLSDLNSMIPLDDPSGLLQRWKEQVNHYPVKLRASIIEQHLAAARFWPSNFHYSSAIERQDVIYTTGIIQQVVHNLIQVLFAVNDTYFPGDKKLAMVIAHLEHVPDQFTECVQSLLYPANLLSVAALRNQQIELQQLLQEIEVIASTVRT